MGETAADGMSVQGKSQVRLKMIKENMYVKQSRSESKKASRGKPRKQLMILCIWENCCRQIPRSVQKTRDTQEGAGELSKQLTVRGAQCVLAS